MIENQIPSSAGHWSIGRTAHVGQFATSRHNAVGCPPQSGSGRGCEWRAIVHQ